MARHSEILSSFKSIVPNFDFQNKEHKTMVSTECYYVYLLNRIFSTLVCFFYLLNCVQKEASLLSFYQINVKMCSLYSLREMYGAIVASLENAKEIVHYKHVDVNSIFCGRNLPINAML